MAGISSKPDSGDQILSRLVGFALGSAIVAALFLALLGLTGRLWWTAAGVLISIAAAHIVSALKFRLLKEPLVFSDFALLRETWRHPHLYYVGALFTVPGAIGFAIYLFTAGLWIWIEPPLLGWAGRLICIALALAICAWLWWGRPAALDRLLARLSPLPDHANDVQRFGLIGSLVLYTARWLAGPVPVAPGGKLRSGPQAPAAIVIVQIESFTDPQAWGGAALPRLMAARERAQIAGELEVPSAGAYTMRPEFEMLTGVNCSDLSFDRFDPYLRGRSFAQAGLPHRLDESFDTVFIHPHDPLFFRRDILMPAYGFRRFIGEGDFSPQDRAGSYIGDVAAGRRIVAEVEKAATPVFIFTVTMENHGPWDKERITGATPAERYAAHLANADQMIGELIAALDRLKRPALLALYGDHPPSLSDLAVGTTTPFVVITWPPRPGGQKHGIRLSPAQLHHAIVGLMAESA